MTSGSGTRRYRDAKGRPVVVVTGMGLVTSVGRSVDETWAAMRAGRSGIRRITRFPIDGLRTTIAGTVDFMGVEPYSGPDLCFEMARSAAQEALDQAGHTTGEFRGPLYLATPPAELEWEQRIALRKAPLDCSKTGYPRLMAAARTGHFRHVFERYQFASVADRLAGHIGSRGLPISVSTACASGASAIQLGVEAIRRGDTDLAISVGTDSSVQLESLIRFSLLSALSTCNDQPEKASRPFSKTRDGFVMAEGAGAVVLESLESAMARSAEILGVVSGCGEKADDYHRTRSRPDGSAIIGAIRNAISDADLAPDAIDYVNAHGTSTPENDKMECLSLYAVMGERASTVPVSSIKSMIGHTLSAAGAIEAVISLLSLQRGVLLPTINYDEPDPDIALDVVPNEARSARIRHVLSNSFGFGGQNVSLVLSCAD